MTICTPGENSKTGLAASGVHAQDECWDAVVPAATNPRSDADEVADDPACNGETPKVWVKGLWAAPSEGAASPALPANPAEDGLTGEAFLPTEPTSFREAGLTDSAVESLALKFLLARGDSSGREISAQIKLPFILIDELLRELKNDRLVGHRGAAPMNDFVYQLTDFGRERAKRFWNHCTYFGAAPVSLVDYMESVQAQSLTGHRPSAERLREAFADMVLNPRMLDRLGPAVNSGRGLFLYGAPGNGKTSVAERITLAFGQEIWIPRAIGVDGEIIRLFDPAGHEEIPVAACTGVYDQRKIDKRWVRIRRPTIIVGGELTMSSLEVMVNTSTGICEAPLQLKSNCGTLLIDDFGRQRMRIDELLNRWIVPLERRYDFLNLPNGKKIQVPFDQLVVFATNLEPKDLVDEAFLRRIPYKIEIVDPNPDEFRELFRQIAPKMGFEFRAEAIEYLLERHYRQPQRPMRYCHPRDLLMQIRNYCAYKGLPMELSNEYFDLAVENYFAVM